MKNFKVVLFCVVFAIASMFVVTSCKAPEPDGVPPQFDGFSVAENVSCEIGSHYNIVAPKVKLDGKAVAITVSVKCKDKAISVVDKVFAVDSFDDYVISYTAATEKLTETKTTTLTATDTTKPVIKIGEHLAQVVINSNVILPQITVEDNSKENIIPSVVVTYGAEIITVTDNKFTAAKTGKYKVCVTATDSKTNPTIVEYEIECYAKQFAEVDNFTYNSASSYAITNGEIFYEKDGYTGSNGGVLKMTSTLANDISVSIAGHEIVKGYENFDFMSIRLFIDGAKNHSAQLIGASDSSVGAAMGDIAFGEWVEVKISKANIKTILDANADNPNKAIGLLINNAEALNEIFSAYIDHIQFGYNDLTYSVGAEALAIIALTSDIDGFNCQVTVKDSNNNIIDVTNGFAPICAGDYIVTYNITASTLADTTLTKKIVVTDSTEPVLTIGEYKTKIVLGKAFTIPAHTIAPITSDATTVMTVYINGATVGTIIPPASTTYMAETAGKYVIKFVATDSRNYSATKEIEFNVYDTTREYNNIATFEGVTDTELENLTNNESVLSLSSTTSNVASKTSVKLSATGGAPNVNIGNADLNMLNRFDYVSFMIKYVGDNTKTHTLQMNDFIFYDVKYYEWTEIKIPKAEYAAALTNGTLVIQVLNQDGANRDVGLEIYIDEIVGCFEDGIVQINKYYTVDTLVNESIKNFNAAIVVKDSKGQTVTMENGKFMATDSDKYIITYTITGDSILASVMTKTIKVSDTRRLYNNIATFEGVTDTALENLTNKESTLSLSSTTSNVNSKTSVKLSGTGGAPNVNIGNADLNMLNRFDYVSFMIKYVGDNTKTHTLQMNDFLFRDVKYYEWTEIKIPKAKYADALTKGTLVIQVLNLTGANRDEGLEIYIDEIVGCFEDKTVSLNSENLPLSNSDILNFLCVMTIADSTGSNVPLTGGNFVPTQAGEYTATYVLSGKTIAQTTITRKFIIKNIIQGFENLTNTSGMSCPNTNNTITLEKSIVYEGSTSLKLSVDGNDGAARLKITDTTILAQMLTGDFVSLDFYIYNFGNNTHEIKLFDSNIDIIKGAQIESKVWTLYSVSKEALVNGFGADLTKASFVFQYDNVGDRNEFGAGMIIDSIILNK